MEQVQSSLMKVKESISLGMPEDFFSIDLMDAYEALGINHWRVCRRRSGK